MVFDPSTTIPVMTQGMMIAALAYLSEASVGSSAGPMAASPATIDAVLTRAGGFRMGPFALMDLVGQDVNEAVTRSVWTAFGYDPRFAPSLLQRAMVEAGWLGRKTGRGWFRYGDDAEPSQPDAAPARSAPSGAQPHSPASVSLATVPPRITSAVRAGDLGRSAKSAISSSVNSSP